MIRIKMKITTPFEDEMLYSVVINWMDTIIDWIFEKFKMEWAHEK